MGRECLEFDIFETNLDDYTDGDRQHALIFYLDLKLHQSGMTDVIKRDFDYQDFFRA